LDPVTLAVCELAGCRRIRSVPGGERGADVPAVVAANRAEPAEALGDRQAAGGTRDDGDGESHRDSSFGGGAHRMPPPSLDCGPPTMWRARVSTGATPASRR